MRQNIWDQGKLGLHRQKRRAQLVTSYLKKARVSTILDVGCAEGYATNFIRTTGKLVIGLEVDLEYLKIAKERAKDGNFINATATNLPFKDGLFDAICILEVLEHLDKETQKESLKEIDRVLAKDGNLIISIPYREIIIQTKCIHCGNNTPLYGHLHSLDETDIENIFPQRYRFLQKCRLPNLQLISCKSLFEPLPLGTWLIVNRLLGFIGKGYWMVLHYAKGR